ncbi:MAG: discoidin domain-containing protein [Steroidobacteraceae bacterium]
MTHDTGNILGKPAAVMTRHALALCCLLLSAIASAAEAPVPATQVIDELDDISAWKTLVSDGVTASIHEARGNQGGAMVLEFDLAKTAGYAVATRKLSLDLPADYELSFWIRGEAGRNHLEIKFVDASGDNVWWYRRPDYNFSGDWQQLRIKRRQIEFAWGPTDDRILHKIASIEMVLAAGRDGGKGSIWFDQLALTPIERSQTAATPVATASSEQGKNAAALALDDRTGTAWRSKRGDPTPTLTIDLQQVREFGGIEIDWLKDRAASNYSIDFSNDGSQWRTVRTVTAGNGGRDSHLLPESEARYVRIVSHDAAREAGIVDVYIRDLAFGASPNAFISSLAQHSRRGCYPRGFVNEQLYWTLVGVDGDREESLLSEDGAFEPRKGSFSVEPFFIDGNSILTWADMKITHSLSEGYLPIPAVQWQHRNIELETRAFGSGERGAAVSRVVYRVHNPRGTAYKVTLALAIRPFQVNPPQQFLNTVGGVATIHELAASDGKVMIDGVAAVSVPAAPTAFRAVPFDADSPCEWLTAKNLPATVRDETGMASGALLYELTLAPNATSEIAIDLPLHAEPLPATQSSQEQIANEWREKLNRVELDLPGEGRAWFDTLRTSLAHVLINRDGAGLQPGSRAYERSWIRDGAMTSQMLLRLGHEPEVREFLLWYADYQFSNGKTPCCVDIRGADPVPENDSPGEFLFLIDELYRYNGDTELLKTLWPRAQKAVDYMEKMRLSERTQANMTPERRMFYGLMPASISHEGYSAKPMHSYWDDFWALAGYEAVVRIANSVGDKAQARKYIQSRDQFRADLYRSLQLSMRTHKIDYLPGAAELGDFDATSTTIAITPVGDQQMLPPDAMIATFERYWKEFDARRHSKSWDAYTPYEWRNMAVFVRLGWRDRALELMKFFMDDRRPAEWNQWAEVVGREPRKARFVGDMPHGWVASDYGRSMLDMLAYERPADETLVLMAGVPVDWIRKDGLAVRRLRTPYGELSYSLKVDGKTRTLEISELARPPNGGVSIAFPEGEDMGRQSIQTGTARWIGSELRVGKLPFKVTFTR